MRSLVLFAVMVPSGAYAQGEPTETAPAEETAKPKKGRIYDPWPRIPRPRDKMRLPDPRTAAEKAAVDDPGTPPTDPPSDAPQVTVEPTEAAATAPITAPPLPASEPALGTTSIARAPEPKAAPHDGLTLEAGTGAGWIHVSEKYRSVLSPQGVAGISIGIGGWVNEAVALTLRLAGSTVPTSDGYVVAGWLGPSMQVWVTQRTWFGIGVGLASFGIDRERPEDDYNLDGLGLDLRFGHAVYVNGHHTINASIEVTPSSVSDTGMYGNSVQARITSIGVLVGWQYL